MSSVPILEQIVVQISRDGQTGNGTGFFISNNLILTCYHVLSKSNELQENYWVQHDLWPSWVKAGPVHALCCPDPIDIALLYCSHPLDIESVTYLTDWDRRARNFSSRGYDQKSKFDVGATTIDGEISEFTSLKQRRRLRLKTVPGLVEAGRSGSPVWSDQQSSIIGLIQWVGGNLEGGRNDLVLAIPISDFFAVGKDYNDNVGIKEALRILEERYLETKKEVFLTKVSDTSNALSTQEQPSENRKPQSTIRLNKLAGEGPEKFETMERLITIGRAPKNMICIDGASVSWEHGQIVLENGIYRYRHLSQTSTTMIESRANRGTRKIQPKERVDYPLYNRDILKIGNSIATFMVEYDLISEDQGYVPTSEEEDTHTAGAEEPFIDS
jgi:pSer/pThr/pTyr-binding forkhead associated (FHA) protein